MYNLTKSSDKKIIYLNYASTSYPKSPRALETYMHSINTVPMGLRMGSGDQSLDKLRVKVAKMLNRKRSESVFFTSGATLALNQVIQGFLEDNSIYIIDNRCHNSIVRINKGINNNYKRHICELYDVNEELNHKKLREILLLKPKLFCLTHASNVNGIIYPIEEIIDEIKKYSPTTAVLVDASQTAGSISLSGLTTADFIIFPSNKHLHSVSGASIIITEHKLRPIIMGGTGENTQNESSLASGKLFAEVGTLDFPAIAAMVASMEYAEENLLLHQKHEAKLYDYLLSGLEKIDELEILGSKNKSNSRLSVVGCKTKLGKPELDWAPFLLSQNIIVRGGLQCSPIHHAQLGLSIAGSLRISYGWYTKIDEINFLLESLTGFIQVLKKLNYV
jgi:selenocysteine lyase/cysteine desulfurase